TFLQIAAAQIEPGDSTSGQPLKSWPPQKQKPAESRVELNEYGLASSQNSILGITGWTPAAENCRTIPVPCLHNWDGQDVFSCSSQPKSSRSACEGGLPDPMVWSIVRSYRLPTAIERAVFPLFVATNDLAMRLQVRGNGAGRSVIHIAGLRPD